MKITKSELKEMIREALREELSKRPLREASNNVQTKIFAFNHAEPEFLWLFVDVPMHLIKREFDYALDMSNEQGLWLIGNTDEAFQCYDLSNFESIADADAWCYNEFKKQVADGEEYVYIEDPIFCEFDAADIDNFKTPIADMLTWEVDGDSAPAFYAIDLATLEGDFEARTMEDFEDMFS